MGTEVRAAWCRRSTHHAGSRCALHWRPAAATAQADTGALLRPEASPAFRCPAAPPSARTGVSLDQESATREAAAREQEEVAF